MTEPPVRIPRQQRRCSKSTVTSQSPLTDQALEIDLRDYIVREMLLAIGRAPDGAARRLLGPFLRIPATRFARLMAGTDAVVGRSTMTAGAQWLLPQLVAGVAVRGAETIPLTGPLLVASNHPGAYDSVAIIASLPPRADLMILASDVPFLRRLPAIGAHTIYVSPDPHARMGVIRAMIRHLEAGGAVMTFGSGLVDPDPDLLPGAAEALEIWYESLAIALRRVPQTQVVVSIVSSVVAPQYMRSPLTRLKQDGWERRKLAEFLQIGAQLLFSKEAGAHPTRFVQPARFGCRSTRGTRPTHHHAANHQAGQSSADGAHESWSLRGVAALKQSLACG